MHDGMQYVPIHSSTSAYMSNFTEIEETLWTDGRTMDGRTFETFLLGQLFDTTGVMPPAV